MSVTRALLLLCYLVAIRGSESSSPVGQEMRERIANGSVNILTTTIVPERVLIRRKRFLIFPKGSAIACTLSMVKALVYKGPRGHNLVAEGDYLYPLPDSVASLKPKRTKLKAVPAPPAPPPPPPPIEAPHPDYSIDDEENHILFNHEYEQQHPDLYVPDSGWRNDPNLAQLVDVPEGKEVPETAAKERIWSQQQQQTTHFDPKLLFQQPHREPVNEYWRGGGPAAVGQWTYDKRPSETVKMRRIDYFPQGRALKTVDKDWKTRKITVPPSGTTQAEGVEARGESPDWTKHEDWEHFEAHRDRRDLYKSLEGLISGINLQPCLLRTICEAQHFLLPKGVSLFHDIFKILFTLPMKESFTDPFAHAMRSKPDDCERFARNCPISILHMFLNSQQSH